MIQIELISILKTTLVDRVYETVKKITYNIPDEIY